MLEFDNLHKSFQDKQVLRGLSLKVRPGEMFGFCGANGAGKTTAMRIALGLLSPDRGQVRWQGKPVDNSVRHRFGYIPEERGLYPRMRPRAQLMHFARIHGHDRREAGRRADLWLERLEVELDRGDRLEALSLGNQQKVQLAVALIHEPDLLVLDEPFSGLDPTALDTVLEVLRERRETGVPVFLSSHQLDLVERLCDSVGIIDQGRIVAKETFVQERERIRSWILEVEVEGARDDWPENLPEVTVVDRQQARVMLRMNNPEREEELLDAIRASGRLTHYAWRRPSVTELFRGVTNA